MKKSTSCFSSSEGRKEGGKRHDKYKNGITMSLLEKYRYKKDNHEKADFISSQKQNKQLT